MFMEGWFHIFPLAQCNLDQIKIIRNVCTQTIEYNRTNTSPAKLHQKSIIAIRKPDPENMFCFIDISNCCTAPKDPVFITS